MLMMILQLFLIIGLNIYLPHRLGNLLALKHKTWLYVLFVFGIVSGFIAMSLITKYANPLVSIYYNLATIWLGTLLYLSCFMVIFEIVNFIHKLPAIKSGYALIIFTLTLTIYSIINASSFKTVYIAIPIKNLKSEVKIAQISDVHLGASRGKKYLEKIVEKTNEFYPDIVAITGDIADSKVALTKDMFSPLKNLKTPAYFVIGNHDVYVGVDDIIDKLKEYNINVMKNDVLVTNGIKLIGLNYMKADDSVYDPHQVNDETIKDVLPVLDLSGDMPKVVLHHGPWGVEYMSERGVDLALTGHTHGGQIFPATLISKAFFPYNRGLFYYKGTYIYVSQGAGTFLPRMRFGTNNEINFITLIPDTLHADGD